MNENGEEIKAPGTTLGRQIRNCIDLLGFAIEREEAEKINVYKEKLCEFPKIFPFSMVELFDRIQYVLPREYYALIMEFLRRINVQFSVSTLPHDDPLESVPIFLACIGAEIQQHQPENFDNFIDIGIYIFNATQNYFCT